MSAMTSSSVDVPLGTSSVSIPSGRGWDLAASIDNKVSTSKDIMVCCHGLLSNKDSSVCRTLSEALEYNICRFDFTGNGKSGGEWGLGNYEVEVQDLREVVLWLRGEGWNPSALLGHSKGAYSVLRYASLYDDVPTIISVAGRFDTTKTPRSRYTEDQWKQLDDEGSFLWERNGRLYPVRKQDLEEKAAINIKGVCTSIKASSVHIIHGEMDDIINVEDAHFFMEHLPKDTTTLDVIKGGSHSFIRSKEGRHDMVASVRRKLGLSEA